MRSFRLLAALALVGGLLFATTAAASATGGRPFTTTLSGAEEVPAPGDADGTGLATITVNPGLGKICYWLEVSGIAPATAAHIHRAPTGVAGVGSLNPMPGSLMLFPPRAASDHGMLKPSAKLIRL